jgi:hypothetical protein
MIEIELSKWQGYIAWVDGETFVAFLTRAYHPHHEIRATFNINEVVEEERYLVEDNRFMNYVIKRVIDDNGNKYNITDISFPFVYMDIFWDIGKSKKMYEFEAWLESCRDENDQSMEVRNEKPV